MPAQLGSLWMREASAGETACPVFHGSSHCDVAIVGGGFVGLWTAIQLKELKPDIQIVILEKDICGGGASGKSSGMVLSYNRIIGCLWACLGLKNALQTVKDSEDAILEIQDFCKKHKIPAQFKSTPWLQVSNTKQQAQVLRSVMQLANQIGRTPFKAVDKLIESTGSKYFLSGYIENSAATVHPGYLIRGLRRVALQMGIKIYENSKVLTYSEKKSLELQLVQGRLQTKKVIWATNVWALQLKELTSQLIISTSDILVSKPSAQVIKKLKLESDHSYSAVDAREHYWRFTTDHRVVFGRSKQPHVSLRTIDRRKNPSLSARTALKKSFTKYYPQLNEVQLASSWQGPIDMTMDRLPLIGKFKKNPNILYAVGWCGMGIGPSRLGGKILANLALEKNNRWSRHPLLRQKI